MEEISSMKEMFYILIKVPFTEVDILVELIELYT